MGTGLTSFCSNAKAWPPCRCDAIDFHFDPKCYLISNATSQVYESKSRRAQSDSTNLETRRLFPFIRRLCSEGERDGNFFYLCRLCLCCPSLALHVVRVSDKLSIRAPNANFAALPPPVRLRSDMMRGNSWSVGFHFVSCFQQWGNRPTNRSPADICIRRRRRRCHYFTPPFVYRSDSLKNCKNPLPKAEGLSVRRRSAGKMFASPLKRG